MSRALPLRRPASARPDRRRRLPLTALPTALLTTLLPLLLVAAAGAQSEGTDGASSSLGPLLALAGISIAVLVPIVTVVFFLHAFCVQVGARVAGLPGGPGRAYRAVLATMLLLVPAMLVAALAARQLGESGVAVLAGALFLVAETVAIKWLYDAPWSRALLVFLTAALLNNAAVSLALLLLF